jgi:hypothetical protein
LATPDLNNATLNHCSTRETKGLVRLFYSHDNNSVSPGLRPVSLVHPDETLFVSWGGFSDPQSYIAEYFFSIQTSNTHLLDSSQQESSFHFRSQGLHTRTKIDLKASGISKGECC